MSISTHLQQNNSQQHRFLSAKILGHAWSVYILFHAVTIINTMEVQLNLPQHISTLLT